MARDGTLWVSEDYGPFVYHFGRDGRFLGKWAPPEDYFPGPGRGREDNKGFESLCLTPGGKLVTLLQSPPAQDGGGEGAESRLLVFDPSASGAPQEYRVPRAEPARLPGNHGLRRKDFSFNELAALTETPFLLLERDNRGFGEEGPKGAAIYKRALRLELRPDDSATVSPFADLLAAADRLGTRLPPKFESLEPGLKRAGREALWTAIDNDFKPELPTYVLLFEVSPPPAEAVAGKL